VEQRIEVLRKKKQMKTGFLKVSDEKSVELVSNLKEYQEAKG